MESILWTVKFALFLAIEVFVVATVGAVLIVGLYQFTRDRVHHILDKIRESRALAPAAVQKGG